MCNKEWRPTSRQGVLSVPVEIIWLCTAWSVDVEGVVRVVLEERHNQVALAQVYRLAGPGRHSLIKPGQVQDGLMYIFQTDDILEVMRLIACFKELVQWNISLAVSTDGEFLDDHLTEEEYDG